jgi:hypothetical protein
VMGPLFLLVGALVSGPAEPVERRGWLWPAALVVASLAALYSLWSPWLSDRKVNAAYDRLFALDQAGARNEAKAAHSLNPLATEPLLVWALTERGTKALGLYRQARDLEPKNAETWYELGAFELRRLDRPRAAWHDLNHAYTLDRYLFTPGTGAARDLDRARCLVDPATCPK